jgi:dienelactone hydrolase
MRRCRLFFPLLIIAANALFAQQTLASEKAISFKTEDGWTIHGTLSIPDNPKGKVPVAILLPSEAHDRAAFGIYRDPGPGRPQYPGLAPAIGQRGVATLSLDLRGRGKSVESKSSNVYDQEDLSKIYLDVRGALAFLDTQPDVDTSRVGIVAVGMSADAAIIGWGGDRRVRAMSFLSGRLSQSAKNQIATSPETSLFLIVSSEDKKGFADMTDAYFLSNNKHTNIEVYDGLGIGTWILSLFRQKFPNEKPLQETIGDWIADQLLSTGSMTEVSFQTEDGWTIYGNFRVPQIRDTKLPAVILLHSGLTDRHVFQDLEVALAKEGLAVLNIDWRGKGKSTGKGQYFDLSREERDRGYLDVKAAVNFLASRPNIDSDRIGVLGTVIGAKYAMAAAVDDARIKTAVVLTGYIPTEKEKTYLIARKPPVLYVTSSGHKAVTTALVDIANQTRAGGSELLIYDGGAIGYQLFKTDKNLMPRVVRWMKEKLVQ